MQFLASSALAISLVKQMYQKINITLKLIITKLATLFMHYYLQAKTNLKNIKDFSQACIQVSVSALFLNSVV